MAKRKTNRKNKRRRRTRRGGAINNQLELNIISTLEKLNDEDKKKFHHLLMSERQSQFINLPEVDKLGTLFNIMSANDKNDFLLLLTKLYHKMK